MESAREFADRYFDGTLKLNGELETMLDARDAAIRAECADRAVAWCKRWATFPMGNHGTGALRAAIIGKED